VVFPYLLIDFIVFVVLAGLGWWVITLVPLPPPMRPIITVVYVLILVLIVIGWVYAYGPHTIIAPR
jgi:hypothetical protein